MAPIGCRPLSRPDSAPCRPPLPSPVGESVEAGIPSREGIKAATVNAAKLLDLSDEIGTIASGKSADVIAVDSSPLDDVSVLERVAFVIARGDVYRA